MPELRIILLVLGVLFVAGIAAFEWWRSRGQKPATVLASRGIEDDVEPASSEPLAREPDAREARALPEINVVREPRVAVPESLPVIELDSASASGARRALGITISDEVAVDVAIDPVVPRTEARRTEPYIGPQLTDAGEEISEVRVIDEPLPGDLRPPPLRLVWPPENERRIVTLRVVPRTEPRFQGRALRQSLAACGFWHGPLEIFHLPDEEGRVLLSAAALAQPGTFDPSIMDSQRFSGLNLFAVLPGAKPEREVFEELVHAARQLAERLGGVIADQHGEELTAARITRLRQSLEAPRAPGEA